jgi:hypothetical protein
MAAASSSLPSPTLGIGMTAEQQAKLFEEFRQADATTAQRFGKPADVIQTHPERARTQ